MVILGNCVLACSQPGTMPTEHAHQQDVARFITPELQGSLQQALSVVRIDTTTAQQLAAEQATELAIPVARAARGIARTLQEDRGGLPVHFESLVPCQTPLYAHSIYQDPSSLPDRLTRLRQSAHWIITFCANGAPELSIAVSTMATDLQRNGNTIAFPKRAGGEFYIKGIPPDWEGGIPVLAPSAIVRAARATGRQVTGVPELFAPASHLIPQAAQWRVRLAPSKLLDSADTSEEEVFAGLRLDGVPATGSNTVQVQRPITHGSTSETVLRFRPGFSWTMSTTFEPVTATGGR